jgi:hypothetical protein
MGFAIPCVARNRMPATGISQAWDACDLGRLDLERSALVNRHDVGVGTVVVKILCECVGANEVNSVVSAYVHGQGLSRITYAASPQGICAPESVKSI